MHIPQNCEPYFAEMGTVLRRTANRIAQKREPYFEETGTVLRRNTNRIAKKRERYNVCAERNLQKGHTLIISSALP